MILVHTPRDMLEYLTRYAWNATFKGGDFRVRIYNSREK